MAPNSLDILKQTYEFLIEEYGFRVKHAQYSPGFMGNSQIIYELNDIAISIVVDRGQVLINIGSTIKPVKEWFEFTDVIHYFDPNLDIVYDYFENLDNANERIIQQANRLAQLLRKYCTPILKRDISMGPKIKEIENERVKKLLQDLNNISPGRTNSSVSIKED